MEYKPDIPQKMDSDDKFPADLRLITETKT